MNSDFRWWPVPSLLLAGMLLASAGSAGSLGALSFAEVWNGSPPVVKELTQIVYYRDATLNKPTSGATLYVDGQYRTTLLPGGYTIFCLKPGTHTLGALLNEPPMYMGKTQGYVAHFQGGKTYYLRVDENGKTLPQQVSSAMGEREMRNTYRQSHALSRSKSVEPCVYDQLRQQPPQDFPVKLGALVDGEMKMTSLGREILSERLITLRMHYPRFSRLVMVLPAIPDGYSAVLASNLHQALIENAIPAASIVIESSASTNTPCSNEEDIFCFLPGSMIILRPDNSPG